MHPLTASNAFWNELHAFSLVSLHSPIFNAHWAVCANASGLRADTNFPDVTRPSWWPVPARRSSIQSTCHFCQWQDTEKWIPKRRRILTVAAAIHRQEAAYLQRAASISFTWERKETACDRVGDNVSRQKSIFSSRLPALSKSIIFDNSKCLRQWGAKGVKAEGQSRKGLDQALISGGLHVDLPGFYSPVSLRKPESSSTTKRLQKVHFIRFLRASEFLKQNIAVYYFSKTIHMQ